MAAPRDWGGSEGPSLLDLFDLIVHVAELATASRHVFSILHKHGGFEGLATEGRHKVPVLDFIVGRHAELPAVQHVQIFTFRWWFAVDTGDRTLAVGA